MRAIALAAFAVLMPLASAAQAPPDEQDWSQGIETVVVTAHRPGPLMWTVRKGDATVYLLGTVDPLPRNLAWDDTQLRAVLADARQLLLPAGASVGIAEGLWFLAWHSHDIYLPDETPMESTLPDGLRKRFVALREALHQDADRYAGLRVPLAALRIESDFLKAHDLVVDEPADSITRIARRLGVRARPVAEYEALPLLRQLPTLSKAENEACMNDALDDMDRLGPNAAGAAQAWAAGDLETLKAHYSDARFQSCLQSMPGSAALFKRAVNDSVGAVNEALAVPGKTVMLVSIGQLLKKEGILDRLAAQGLSIAVPGS